MLSDGKRVVYVEKISRDRQQADNLFIAEEQKPSADKPNNAWIVVSAARGSQEKIVAYAGKFYCVARGFSLQRDTR